MTDNIDYEALGERVEKAMHSRKRSVRVAFFSVSLFLFVLFTLIGLGITGSTAEALGVEAGRLIPIMLMPGLGWALALLYQGLALAMDYGMGDRRLRGQVLQEVLGEEVLARMQAQALADLKRKNRLGDEPAMTVSDDGELVPLSDDAGADDEQRRRNTGG